MISPKTRPLLALFALLPLPLLAGCAALGIAAHAMPPPTILPRYTNLDKQSVAVMVWADRGTRIDFPTVQVDLATMIQKKLEAKQAETKGKTLAGTTFPVPPASVVRFQQDHPELDGAPIAMVAPRLNVSRLIFVEIEQFATRSDLSVDLFRGTAEASVRVVEVADKKASAGYTENGLKTAFPPKAPREGLPNVGDYTIYRGTLDGLATEITNSFLPHPEEEP